MIANRRTNGMAMLYALLLMVVVVGIGALMFARTVAEIQHSGDDAAIVQTLLLARGSANVGGQVLQGAVRAQLQQIVGSEPRLGRWAFGDGPVADPLPTSSSVVADLADIATSLQTRIDAILCGGASTFSPVTGATGSFRVYFTGQACGVALPDGVQLPGGRFVEGNPRQGTTSSAEQTFAMPFVMVAEGEIADFRRNVVVQGEFRFTVGKGSFAKYALFTNVHRTTSNGSDIWFTKDTLFDGPVHTNNYFRFFENPWFGDSVTSAGCSNPGANPCNNATREGAAFWGYPTTDNFMRWQDMPSYDNPFYNFNPQGPNNDIYTAPDLNGDVDWEASFIPMPTNNQDQRGAAEDDGILVTGNVHRLTVWAADANGNELSVDANGVPSPAATYQYIEVRTANNAQSRTCEQDEECYLSGNSSTASTTVYRYDSTGLLQRRSGSGPSYTWTTETTSFNGVIHVDGTIRDFTGPERPSGHTTATRTPPALASFAAMTLSSNSHIRITGDLKYESPPCTGTPTRSGNTVTAATCNNLDAKNVLGVYTQNGDIFIGNATGNNDLNAPDNVTIHGVLMSGTGKVTTERFRTGSGHGKVNLLGGIIEYFYGAFGTFNSQTGEFSSGYGRAFTYDRRMSLGVEPPYFPTVTNDGVRKVSVFSFGQREQIY